MPGTSTCWFASCFVFSLLVTKSCIGGFVNISLSYWGSAVRPGIPSVSLTGASAGPGSQNAQRLLTSLFVGLVQGVQWAAGTGMGG